MHLPTASHYLLKKEAHHELPHLPLHLQVFWKSCLSYFKADPTLWWITASNKILGHQIVLMAMNPWGYWNLCGLLVVSHSAKLPVAGMQVREGLPFPTSSPSETLIPQVASYRNIPLPLLLQSLQGVTVVRGKEEWNKKAVLTACFSSPASRLPFWAEWANPPLLQLHSSLEQQGEGRLEAQQPAGAFWEESALSHHTITLHHYHYLACTMTSAFHKWLINGYYFYFSF